MSMAIHTTIFTIPALYLWGVVPPYMQIAAIALLGGILGISAMILFIILVPFILGASAFAEALVQRRGAQHRFGHHGTVIHNAAPRRG